MRANIFKALKLHERERGNRRLGSSRYTDYTH